MDWTTFFIENSQSLFTLGGVFLGSALTFLIGFLNLKNQSIERDKDRQEQRREANIKAKEKWIERDVLQIMDSVDRLLGLISEMTRLSNRTPSFKERRDAGMLTTDEAFIVLKATYERVEVLGGEISEALDTMSRLTYSFRESEINSSYTEFMEAGHTYLAKKTLDNWHTVRQKAGNLQKVLREKLISIRETA